MFPVIVLFAICSINYNMIHANMINIYMEKIIRRMGEKEYEVRS
jgi:hypothetical protein